MRTIVRSLVWILPFFSFLAGYQFLRFISHTEVVPVPSVVGLHMHDAIKMLSANRLNVRILAEKEDADVPKGIIISQTPHAGKVVKPHQSIFLVITRKPPMPKAPSFFGLSRRQAMVKARQIGIQVKTYQIDSLQPEGTIIAQNRQTGEELADKSMILYYSGGTTPMRIIPSLRGRTVEEVRIFFKPYGISVVARHLDMDTEHICSSCIIIDQRPLAGMLVNLKKGFSVQVTALSPS